MKALSRSGKAVRWAALLPVAVGLLAVAKIELVLTRLLAVIAGDAMKASAGKLCGRIVRQRGALAGRVAGKRAAAGPMGAAEVVTAYLAWLEGRDDEAVDFYRRAWEREHGVSDEGRRHDPHLYAVLYPTKAENLTRIGWAMLRVEPGELWVWLDKVVPVLMRLDDAERL